MEEQKLLELEDKIVAAKSDEEVIQIFADAGITVTPEQMAALAEGTNGELSEDALDNVSGGALWYIGGKLIGRYFANGQGGGHRF